MWTRWKLFRGFNMSRSRLHLGNSTLAPPFLHLGNSAEAESDRAQVCLEKTIVIFLAEFNNKLSLHSYNDEILPWRLWRIANTPLTSGGKSSSHQQRFLVCIKWKGISANFGKECSNSDHLSGERRRNTFVAKQACPCRPFSNGVSSSHTCHQLDADLVWQWIWDNDKERKLCPPDFENRR